MNDVKQFRDLIKDIKFAMLTTTSAHDGVLRSRPMTLQEEEFDGELWFFAKRGTSPVEDVTQNSSVNLAFADVKNNSYVSASGNAQIVDDKTKAKELWNPLYKAWFPEGLEDPQLCLLKVTVESADYWESPSSTVVHLLGFAKAVITGRPAHEIAGERGHLKM